MKSRAVSADSFPSHLYLDRLAQSIILALFLKIISSQPAHAEQVFTVALGALEEGDERYRPEWIGRWTLNTRFQNELHIYGRTQGRVRQSTLMLTSTYNYPILGSKWIMARLGGAMTRDETVIRGADADTPTRSHSAYNFGAYLGLGIQGGSKWTYSFDWNNAQFLAGSAGIFLATARKQSISLGLGWRI